jgi:hypothetical protein
MQLLQEHNHLVTLSQRGHLIVIEPIRYSDYRKASKKQEGGRRDNGGAHKLYVLARDLADVLLSRHT